MLRLLLTAIMIFSANPSWAEGERFFVHFTLLDSGQEIERGTLITSAKRKTWTKGLKRSFLRLTCQEDAKGTVSKHFSTEDHFSGLLITHQHVGNHLQLQLTRTDVVPRATEIKQLKKQECRELAPLVTQVQAAFDLEARDVKAASLSIGEGLIFQYSIYPILGH